jgi:HEAT repeat protein
MKDINSSKNKKSLITTYLNNLKSSNSEKVAQALLNLYLEDYPDIANIAKNYVNSENSFVRFSAIYVLAMCGNFEYLTQLVDYIKDDSKFIRKVAISGINSVLPEKLIKHTYNEIEDLKKEFDNIKTNIGNLRNKVIWDAQQKMFTY